MSDKDDHKHDDADLASFLDGSDGVSDAYRNLEQVQPPAHLDARILAAARGAAVVGEQKSPDDFAVAKLRGRLSLAASLVLGVIIGSQFPADLRLQQEAASSMEKAASQDEASQASAGTPSRQVDAEAVAESFAVAEDIANAAPPGPGAPRSIQAQGQTAGLAAAEEVLVSGARLQRSALPAAAPAAAAAEPVYRQSVVAWLQEISRLQEQMGDSDSPVLQQQINGERALFQQRYPGIDLDLELENLDISEPRD